MQNTSAQLLFHVRLDPLKLAKDPLKVVAGSPRDLKILAEMHVNVVFVMFVQCSEFNSG